MNLDALLPRLTELPPWLTYVVLGVGAAVENVFPPIPADTVVLFGAFLAGLGQADPWLVLASTWAANVIGAVAVYFVARRYGEAAFASGPGRWLLHPGQLERIARFYARWGASALFLSRFFPGVRALVPVFAGVSRMRPVAVAVPLATASFIWYGALVWVGAVSGRNWEELKAFMERAGGPLGWAGAVILVLLVVWWVRTRRAR
ncbi:MAG: DedA family protein [Gemmatimonadota bacterium]